MANLALPLITLLALLGSAACQNMISYPPSQSPLGFNQPTNNPPSPSRPAIPQPSPGPVGVTAYPPSPSPLSSTPAPPLAYPPNPSPPIYYPPSPSLVTSTPPANPPGASPFNPSIPPTSPPPTRVQVQPPTLRALVRVQWLILRGQTHQQCILHQAQAQAHQPQFHPPIRLQALAQSCLAQYRVHPITLLVVLV